jgi:hypothetical protein
LRDGLNEALEVLPDLSQAARQRGARLDSGSGPGRLGSFRFVGLKPILDILVAEQLQQFLDLRRGHRLCSLRRRRPGKEQKGTKQNQPEQCHVLPLWVNFL